MTELATAATATVAFEEFFEAERGKLFGAVYLMTGSVEEAEEIVQDAFLAVWERWDRVRDMERPTGYVYRIAMNRFRSRRRHLACAARRGLPFRSAEDPYEAVDLHDEVVRALRGLTPHQRAALVLTELLGCRSDEAAAFLGVRPSTIRNLAAQARASLKRAMEHDDD
jgi:RNA polymerase sigma-70 factor (ECF subfamily)